MYTRYVKKKIVAALQDTPAIIIVGPRQCGKTTLVKQIIEENWTYITLDDLNQLQFAKNDPVGFIQHCTSRHVVIDEIQRVPELILPIKQSIDENRLPGRFLLTGSANALALPQVADSLTGRLKAISL
jgi:predicted AAA+ superfamily ATPase